MNRDPPARPAVVEKRYPDAFLERLAEELG